MKTMPSRTETLLGIQGKGVDFIQCQSRSLMFERLANPELEKSEREKFFRNATFKPVEISKPSQWLWFLLEDLKLLASSLLFAQLQSRLMVNMAGGVMENAGVCLDRLSGLPYAPGSAVRGCARRVAIQRAVDEPDPAKKKALLVEAALVFGWAEEDWKTKQDHGAQWEKKRPDFAVAAGDDLWHQPGFIGSIQQALWAGVHGSGSLTREMWKTHLSHYRGQARFLPAYPLEVSDDPLLPLKPPRSLGAFELDVLTSHHSDYYSRAVDSAGTRTMPEAKDLEDPIPVVFPSVAPGHVFVFAVLGPVAAKAQDYLKDGLRTFGVGAKTNAGYGWFETDCVDTVVRSQVEAWDRDQRVAQKKRETDRRAAKDKADREAAELQRLAKLSPQEQRAAALLGLPDQQFADMAKRFDALPEDERLAFVLALRQSRKKAKRWAENKPELLRPWQTYAQKLQPPISLP